MGDMEGFQPAMMSFKSFLQTQDDQISDEEAIKKYADYKLEFKRQQLNEFFVSHKDEECGGDPSEEVAALQPFVEVATSEQQTAPSVAAAAAAVTPPATADEESVQERNIDPNSKVLNDLV